MRELDARARRYGIALDYISEAGERREISDGTKRRLLELLAAGNAAPAPPAKPKTGKPPRCHLPGFLRHGRAWGIACQLYGLRSARNWGIGDFADLGLMAEIAGNAGADFLGINPVHALFPLEPGRASPYSPSSRQFLNVLHIAPDAEPEFAETGETDRARERLRRGDLVDYRAVAAVKLRKLRDMFATFREKAAGERKDDWDTFRAERGRPLEDFSLFEALSARFEGARWRDWPNDFKGLDRPSVRRFAARNAAEIDFHAWLQWLADRQLARAQARALKSGMRIGLYLDLAVGVAGDGAAAWSRPDLVADGAHIGSPPDPFHTEGQNWSLVPPRPNVLLADGMGPLKAELAANMRHAGAARLDHVMALERLFWVPEGLSPADGGYVHYPFAEMAAAVAEQSRRFGVLVIGEALGTVPKGFRERLAAREIQSYRVLFFEKRRDGGFRRPTAWPRRALACVGTHDLPTLRGWWMGHDLSWRVKAGTVSKEEMPAALEARRAEARRLWQALGAVGLVAAGAGPPRSLGARHVVAVHRYIARGPSRLVAVQLEDALGQVEQANLPGDSTHHPNWRRKMPVALEALSRQPLFGLLTRAMAAERPRQ
jgi:4-alpha-glucanotransferase